jgi:hypothetical protein
MFPGLEWAIYKYYNVVTRSTAFHYKYSLSARNIAKGKPAFQKTTYHGAPASRAVDGRTDPNWGQASCSSTTDDNRIKDHWWAVDLQVHGVKNECLPDKFRCRQFQIAIAS